MPKREGAEAPVAEKPKKATENVAEVKTDNSAPKEVKKSALQKKTEDYLKYIGMSPSDILDAGEKSITNEAGTKRNYLLLDLADGEEGVKNFLLKASTCKYDKVFDNLHYEVIKDDDDGTYLVTFFTI